MLGIVLENAPKLDSIMDTLLDVKRFQSREKLNLQRNLCRVEDFVVDALWPIQEESPDSRVVVKVSNEKARVWVDFERIRRVLVELVTNAIKFSSGKLITVSGHIAGNNYCLSVQDNGAGIPPEQIVRIFRHFYRVDSTSLAPEGLGFGLSWAKGVVETHGG
jgi:K+-sensing histidine kinase KdpD